MVYSDNVKYRLFQLAGLLTIVWESRPVKPQAI
jgi:hypothetical protein